MRGDIALIVCCFCITVVMTEHGRSKTRQNQVKSTKNQQATFFKDDPKSSQEVGGENGEASGAEESTHRRDLRSKRAQSEERDRESHDSASKLQKTQPHKESSEDSDSDSTEHGKVSRTTHSDENSEESSAARSHDGESAEKRKDERPKVQSRPEEHGDMDENFGDASDTRHTEKPGMGYTLSTIEDIIKVIGSLSEEELEQLKKKIFGLNNAKEYSNDGGGATRTTSRREPHPSARKEKESHSKDRETRHPSDSPDGGNKRSRSSKSREHGHGKKKDEHDERAYTPRKATKIAGAETPKAYNNVNAPKLRARCGPGWTIVRPREGPWELPLSRTTTSKPMV